MITDVQVRKLKKYLSQGKSLEVASRKAGMDEMSGRKYRDLGKMPSEIKAERNRDWRTRQGPFADVWAEAESFLANNEGLEAKTLFAHLQREHPVQFADGQLRTFQRRVKTRRRRRSTSMPPPAITLEMRERRLQVGRRYPKSESELWSHPLRY